MPDECYLYFFVNNPSTVFSTIYLVLQFILYGTGVPVI